MQRWCRSAFSSSREARTRFSFCCLKRIVRRYIGSAGRCSQICPFDKHLHARRCGQASAILRFFCRDTMRNHTLIAVHHTSRYCRTRLVDSHTMNLWLFSGSQRIFLIQQTASCGSVPAETQMTGSYLPTNDFFCSLALQDLGSPDPLRSSAASERAHFDRTTVNATLVNWSDDSQPDPKATLLFDGQKKLNTPYRLGRMLCDSVYHFMSRQSSSVPPPRLRTATAGQRQTKALRLRLHGNSPRVSPRSTWTIWARRIPNRNPLPKIMLNNNVQLMSPIAAATSPHRFNDASRIRCAGWCRRGRINAVRFVKKVKYIEKISEE